MEDIKTTYSEKLMGSDALTLLAKHPDISDAFAKSTVKTRTTFYDYSQLTPLKNLLSRQKLTRSQCFNALEIVKSLQKKHSKETINKVLKLLPYNSDFALNASALAKSIESCNKEINGVLSENYEVLDFAGFYLPIKEKTSKIETIDKLLALSVWSISITPKGALELIQSRLPEGHYLKNPKTRSIFLTKLISNLFRSLNVEIAYQAVELLITTRTEYRNAALELLTNGWVVSE